MNWSGNWLNLNALVENRFGLDELVGKFNLNWMNWSEVGLDWMNWSENWFELNELVGSRFGLDELVGNRFELD